MVCQKLRLGPLGHALVHDFDLCRLKRAHSIRGHPKQTDLKNHCPILFLSTFNYWVDPCSFSIHSFGFLRLLSFILLWSRATLLEYCFSFFLFCYHYLVSPDLIFNIITPLSFSFNSNLVLATNWVFFISVLSFCNLTIAIACHCFIPKKKWLRLPIKLSQRNLF